MNQAVLWDEVHNQITWNTDPGDEFLAFMAKHYWGKENLEFLDLGCGTGASTLFLTNKGFKVTAVDISKIACDKLYENIPDKEEHLVKIINSDILDLDFIKGSFDCVIAIGLIDCLELEQSNSLFDRIKPWLRPNGRFFGRVLASEIPGEIKRGNTRARPYLCSEVMQLLDSNEYKGIIKVGTAYVSEKMLPITSWIFEATVLMGT